MTSTGNLNLSDARVLVTGGTGFIGGRLVEKLVVAHGAQVRVLTRRPQSAVRVARLPVDLCVGTITDEAAVRTAVEGCDVILHCAHDPGARRRQRQLATRAARHLIDVASSTGVQRIVHMSSLAVYGPTADGDLTEESPWTPIRDDYVQAKRSVERLLHRAQREQGLPVVTLQPTAVYGPYGKVWTAVQVRDMQDGLIPLIDGGHGLCNAVYVDDVVDAIVLAATTQGIEGEAFLISGPEPVPWATFYGAFESILGARRTIDVPRADLPHLARLEQRRSRRALREWVGTSIRGWLHDPNTVALVRDLASVQRTIDLLAATLPDEQWAALKRRVSSDGRSGRPPNRATAMPRIIIPNDMLLNLYVSKTHVRIDKARTRLGYEPRFDFDRGMRLTGEFLRWSGIV